VPQTYNTQGVPTDSFATAEARLERSVLGYLLWEDNFYESGTSIAQRIGELIREVKPEYAASLAIQARTQMKLRSVPLLIAAELTRLRWAGVKELLPAVIQRADELAEFLAVWTTVQGRTGRKVLNKVPKSVIKGLDAALRQFNEYALARNLGESRAIKLRDVIRIVHPKPDTPEQAELWEGALEGTLKFPDSWQTRLAAGEDKLTTWTALLAENKLGALDILKNVRNMAAAGVEPGLINARLIEVCHKVDLPFRYLQAAQAVPAWEGWIETAMLAGMQQRPRLGGKTLLLVDVSGSMNSPLSSARKPGMEPMKRMDAAAAVAMLLREVCEQVKILTFSDNLVEIAPRRGMALRDAIVGSQLRRGTDLGEAVALIRNAGADRLILVSDEESQTDPGQAPFPRSYLINVASTERGIGYGAWTRITGFSEAVIDFVQAYERSVG
jgi:hypothetical protein